jgi:hypothetical protein
MFLLGLAVLIIIGYDHYSKTTDLIPAYKLQTKQQKEDIDRPKNVASERKRLIHDINESSVDEDGLVYMDDYTSGYYIENLKLLQTYGYYCKFYHTDHWMYVRISIKPQPVPINSNVIQEDCKGY